MLERDTRIFVITHKETPLYNGDGYYPLFVGAERNKPEQTNGYLMDDEGESISEKNDSYCELTGLYYIWKNIQAEYVGLVHYRRYFLNPGMRLKLQYNYFVRQPRNYTKTHIISVEEAKTELQKTDILVKKSKIYRKNLGEMISYFTGEECLKEFTEVLLAQKDVNSDALRRYFKRHSFVECNMFISSKPIIDRYCAWLFPILQQVENLHFEHTAAKYQHREMGYLAEYIFGYWLEANQIRCKVLDVISPGESKAFELLSDIFVCGSNIENFIHLPNYLLKEIAKRLAL